MTEPMQSYEEWAAGKEGRLAYAQRISQNRIHAAEERYRIEMQEAQERSDAEREAAINDWKEAQVKYSID